MQHLTPPEPEPEPPRASRPAQPLVVCHPLAQIHLTGMRQVDTPPARFRWHLNRLGEMLFLEASRSLMTTQVEVKTPLAVAAGARMARPLVLAPILRAGLGLTESVLPLVPDAVVIHLGICRNELTSQPEWYYSRAHALPADADVFLLDPMLATGGSACAAAKLLKSAGAARITFIGVVGCPAGIGALQAAHPDVRIVLAAIDERLDARNYIVPGLGDAGDRCFGT